MLGFLKLFNMTSMDLQISLGHDFFYFLEYKLIGVKTKMSEIEDNFKSLNYNI